MSPSNNGAANRDFDAERCLQALSGSPAEGAHTDPSDRSARAGRLLRVLVLAELQAQQAEPDPSEAALLARLQASGALTPRTMAATDLSWAEAAWLWLKHVPRAWLSLPALATVAGVGLLVLMQPTPNPQPPAFEDDAAQMRGSEQAQRLTAPDPAALADAVQALLTARQLPLRRQQLGSGQIELQARVPAGDAALAQALAQLGVNLPAHGRLWLLIASSKAGR